MTKSKRTPTDTAEKLYRETRSGATAARGYHYQDAIGAWFAIRLLVGDVQGATRVVPEDWEDITVEGSTWTHVQIKSRQAGRRFFSVSEVAKIVIEMWEKHCQRRAVDVESSKLLLLLERGLNDETPQNVEIALTDTPKWKNVQKEIQRLAPVLSGKLETLASITRVHVIDGATACRESSDLIASSAGAYPAAARIVVQSVRTAIIDSTDQNATREIILGRIGLGVSSVNRIVKETLGLVDQKALEEAIRLGDCEALDFSIAEVPSGFYQGIAVQPGHIAANLATPRPDLVEQALASLKAGTHVLLEGPSGVGKSTAMWLTAQASPEILWHRIRPSATGAAIAGLLKLARASAPSTQHQVGFIVDGVGLAETGIWDGMVREASAVPGLVLLGSIRTEDAFLIRTRSACEIITVSLDEGTAADIHRKLVADGATEAPHWREAFEKSEQLTMEYTHLLTQGKRIQDVVEEQVVRRVQEDREVELDVIALVSTADQWGAHLDFQSLVSATSATPGDLRKALARLGGEHIVREDGEQVRGVHQLRSRFLSQSVHAYPPPLLATTVERLVGQLESADLSMLIIGALSERAVDESSLLEWLIARLVGAPVTQRVQVFAATLNALREVEFRRRVTSWNEVFRAEDVPATARLAALQFSMVENPSMPGVMEEVQKSLPKLQPLTGSDFALGTELLSRLPARFVVELLASCGSFDDILSVLGALPGTEFAFANETTVLLADSPFAKAVIDLDLDRLGELLTAAYEIDQHLAACIIDRVGGGEAILVKLQESIPWIAEAKIVDEDGQKIPHIRAVHVADRFQRDGPDDGNLELAKKVARLFPFADHVDVQTRFAGNIPVQFGDYEQGVSTLQNRYMHSSISVAWRRNMLAIAAAAYGSPSQTERASLAVYLLEATRNYLQLLGTVWIRGGNRQRDIASMQSLSEEVLLKLDSVMPFVPADPTQRPDAPPLADPLFALAGGVFSNLTSRLVNPGENLVTLSCFVHDNLRKALSDTVASEQWRLVDFDPTEVAEAVDRALYDLACVLNEKGWEGELAKPVSVAARSGESKTSLSRAADACRRLQRGRRDSSLTALRRELASRGIECQTHVQDLDPSRLDIWPPYRLLLAVKVSTVWDWLNKQNTLVEVVNNHFCGKRADPAVWAVPTLGDKPVRQLCIKVFKSALGMPDEVTAWDSDIGPAHETPLADCVAGALDELDILSGMAYLSAFRETSSLQAEAEGAGGKFRQKYQELCGLFEVDPRIGIFVRWVDEQVERVQGELDRRGESDPNTSEFFAVETARGVTGGSPPSEMFNQRVLSTMLAIQYDIDPEDGEVQAILDPPRESDGTGSASEVAVPSGD